MNGRPEMLPAGLLDNQILKLKIDLG